MRPQTKRLIQTMRAPSRPRFVNTITSVPSSLPQETDQVPVSKDGCESKEVMGDFAMTEVCKDIHICYWLSSVNGHPLWLQKLKKF